jgi:hypothetical protein
MLAVAVEVAAEADVAMVVAIQKNVDAAMKNLQVVAVAKILP